MALVKLLKAVGKQELTGDVFVSLLERLAQANVAEPSSVVRALHFYKTLSPRCPGEGLTYAHAHTLSIRRRI